MIVVYKYISMVNTGCVPKMIGLYGKSLKFETKLKLSSLSLAFQTDR